MNRILHTLVPILQPVFEIERFQKVNDIGPSSFRYRTLRVNPRQLGWTPHDASTKTPHIYSFIQRPPLKGQILSYSVEHI